MMRRGFPTIILLIVGSAAFLTGCTDPAMSVCFITGGTYNISDSIYPVGSCVYPGSKSAVAAAGDALFVNAAAHVAGAQGTNWRSDLEVHNLGNEVADFRVILLEHGADNSEPDMVELTLASGLSMRLGDVLQAKFGIDGTAALVLVPSSGQIIVTSRTYNLLGAGNDLGLPAGATFGQYIPAVPLAEAIGHGEQGRLIQLSHSTATDGGARANLGVVNATGAELRVKIELHTADGEILGTVSRTIPPYGYLQVNRIFESVTSEDVEDGYAVVFTTTVGGAFFAYASVVDNLTGDPVAISATRLPDVAPAGQGDPVYVAAAAHVAGAAGTNWRTDLEIHNWGDEEAAYTIWLLEHGTNNTAADGRSYVIQPGTSKRFEDVLDTVFQFEGAASLRINPQTGRILVTSRTYNLLGKDNDLGLPAGATFGQYIPGVTAEQALGFGEEGRLIQLAHSTDDTKGFRTNLILVNAKDAHTDVQVDLYEGNGVFLGTVERSLKPFEYRQLNRVFASVTGGDVDDGYVVVRTTTQGGRFFAMASVVDNLTGDPVGMGAPVILSGNGEEVLRGVEGTMQILGQTDLDSVLDRMQDLGVAGLVGSMVAAQPDVAQSTNTGMVINYGDGWIAEDGSIHEGSIDINTSGVSIDSAGIRGTLTISHDGYLIDGEPPAVGPTAWTFDLIERVDGSVVGQIDIAPEGGPKSAGSMSGTIGIDTEICLEYPISGSLTTTVDNEVITITFGPECDGSVDHGLTPSKTFSYSYGDPSGPTARDYIVSTNNAEVEIVDSVRYWRATVGGEDLGETEPGVITYHFPFDGPAVSGHLLAQLAVWHFSYSRGHAYLYGSTDGVDWQLLAEVPPPDLGQGRGGGWNGDLPAMFIGETDIWLQIRLYSFGPNAAAGGIYCNTAQHSRWDSNGPTTTFELEVELE